MLPKTGNILKQDFTIQKQPSKTYRLKDRSISGNVDGIEAVKQAVYCILSTRRFEHIIYSWNYGQEFTDLHGGSMDMVKTKIKKRIREALTQDDRIRDVGAFSFAKDGKKLLISFTVSCDLGEFQAEKEVNTGV